MCDAGFIGQQCESVPSTCDPNPCWNGFDCFVDAVGKLKLHHLAYIPFSFEISTLHTEIFLSPFYMEQNFQAQSY